MNEPQFNAVVFLSGINIVACSSHTPSCPLWMWLLAVLFWPSVAVAINLVYPSTEDKQSVGDAADPNPHLGWQCAVCQWHTTSLTVMRDEVVWPVNIEPVGVVGELVCPQCGSVGEFIDYEE